MHVRQADIHWAQAPSTCGEPCCVSGFVLCPFFVGIVARLLFCVGLEGGVVVVVCTGGAVHAKKKGEKQVQFKLQASHRTASLSPQAPSHVSPGQLSLAWRVQLHAHGPSFPNYPAGAISAPAKENKGACRASRPRKRPIPYSWLCASTPVLTRCWLDFSQSSPQQVKGCRPSTALLRQHSARYCRLPCQSRQGFLAVRRRQGNIRSFAAGGKWPSSEMRQDGPREHIETA